MNSTTDLTQAVATLQKFSGPDLTLTLAKVEASLQGVTVDECTGTIAAAGADPQVLTAASLIKRLTGQINVMIHALGILVCLPRLLDPGEAIQYVSLGAGNTGRAFDLETTHRVAEFKFIRWQGGAEVIRQNALFKDFYLLAESATTKRKFLYVLGTEHPLKFFNSGRSLSSVLSRNVRLHNQFRAKYGNQYQVVRDYYAPRKDTVLIQDLSALVAGLATAGIDGEEDEV